MLRIGDNTIILLTAGVALEFIQGQHLRKLFGSVADASKVAHGCGSGNIVHGADLRRGCQLLERENDLGNQSAGCSVVTRKECIVLKEPLAAGAAVTAFTKVQEGGTAKRNILNGLLPVVVNTIRDGSAAGPAGHHQIAQGKVDPKLVYHRLTEIYDDLVEKELPDGVTVTVSQYIDWVSQRYAEAYDLTDMSDEEIFEEILCDALADMNGFDNQLIANQAQKLLKDLKSEALGQMENDGVQKTGPPAEGKFSIETLPDGRKYVRADRQVIFGNDPDSWCIQVEDYINGKIRRGQDVQLIAEDGDVLILTSDTAGKLSDYNPVREK